MEMSELVRLEKRDAVGVRIDRKRKQSVTVLLKALGWDEARILERFGGYESMRATLEKDHTTGQDDAPASASLGDPGRPPCSGAGSTSGCCSTRL